MDTRCSLTRTARRLSAVVLLIVAQAAVAAEGDYIVTFNGTQVPAGFAASVAQLGGRIMLSHPGAGIAVLRGLNAAAAAQLGSGEGITGVVADVAYPVEDFPESRVLAATPVSAVASAADPTSAFFYGLGFQWDMQAIHAPQAWAKGKLGSPDVTVAIIDTGIDYRSFDMNGLVDLDRSISFIPTDDALVTALFPGVHPSTDLHGHGTHVATQVSSNALALAGVTSRTRLISVKVADVRGLALVSSVLFGIAYAADNGADVANVSLGSLTTRKDVFHPPLIAAIQQLFNYANKKGMLVVAGAGNDAADLDHSGNQWFVYCEGVHVVCVSATGPLTPTGSPYVPAIYTNYGRSAIGVAAPGGNYGGPVSQWPWGPSPASYVWSLCSRTLVVLDAAGNPIATPCASGLVATGAFGTSLATPHVTGLAALLVAEYGKLKPPQLKSKLMQCTADLGQPGTDPYYGKGHIDLARCF